MRTCVYIDGFNFYYGAVKGTPYKWLDFSKLCGFLLPKSQIENINYYTARVKPPPDDPQQQTRQQAYLRALATIPNLETHFGLFTRHKVYRPVAGYIPLGGSKKGDRQTIRIVRTEEKGSDVNLASHLLHDGHLGRYDLAVLITNDSDLVTPIKLVREDLGLDVGVLNPQKHPSHELAGVATFMKTIRSGVVSQSQFPATLKDSKGVFRKPATW